MEATNNTPVTTTAVASANNRVNIVGFVATEPQIREFETASVIRFALSVLVDKTSKESKLVNVEHWVRNENSASIKTIQKGQRISVFGQYNERVWQGADGQEHSRQVMSALSIKNAPLTRKDAA